MCCFAQQNKQLLRPAGIKRLQKAVQEEDSVVLIISASVDNWVCPFFDEIDKKDTSVRYSNRCGRRIILLGGLSLRTATDKRKYVD